MRLPQTIFLLVLFLAQAGLALDITTNDGLTYKQCEITRVEPDALRISHADGAARIAYEKLPIALQKQYFDAAKVTAYRQQAEVARQAAAAKAAEERRQREQAAARAAQQEREQAAEERRQEEERRAAAQRQEQERIAAEESRKATEATFNVILVIGGIVIGLFIYFIPSIVGRHKTNAGAIFVLNFLLGWSFIGWVAALVWACSKDSAIETMARERMATPGRGSVQHIDAPALPMGSATPNGNPDGLIAFAWLSFLARIVLAVLQIYSLALIVDIVVFIMAIALCCSGSRVGRINGGVLLTIWIIGQAIGFMVGFASGFTNSFMHSINQ